MIREALQWMEGLVVGAQTPIEIAKRDGRITYLFRDGREVKVDYDPPNRRHKVETLEDFAKACSRWRTEKSVVFHNLGSVVLLIDDEERRSTVTLKLQVTEVAKVLQKLDESESAMAQRTFLRLLRRDLRYVVPASLITAISNIEVISNSQSKSEINPGRERGTREFAADLASEKIPDLVTCQVPLYQLPGLERPFPVQCSLDYTLPPHPVEFAFRPLADELDNAFRAAQQLLQGMLIEELNEWDNTKDLDVLYGEPF